MSASGRKRPLAGNSRYSGPNCLLSTQSGHQWNAVNLVNIMARTVFIICSLLIGVALFFPILFLLAKTPIHDGSEMPSALMVSVTTLISLAIGAGSTRLIVFIKASMKARKK
jgi:hypothetical protein